MVALRPEYGCARQASRRSCLTSLSYKHAGIAGGIAGYHSALAVRIKRITGVLSVLPTKNGRITSVLSAHYRRNIRTLFPITFVRI